LGVHKKSSNFAVRGELGSLPISLKFLKLTLKYWIRLIKLDDQSLLHKSYIECYKLNENKNINWLSHIETLLKYFKMNDFWNNQDIPHIDNFLQLWTKETETKYKDEWIQSLNADLNNSKLRSFAKYKHSYKLENYLLNTKNFKAKKLLTKLRISAHDLHIETGRYHKPKKIPLDQRTCHFCNQNLIEDEIHLVLDCSFYDEFRASLFTELENICDFNQLCRNDKFILIMSANDGDIDFCCPIGNFLIKCFEKRKNNTSNI
jgi:hypothetical protein